MQENVGSPCSLDLSPSRIQQRMTPMAKNVLPRWRGFNLLEKFSADDRYTSSLCTFCFRIVAWRKAASPRLAPCRTNRGCRTILDEQFADIQRVRDGRQPHQSISCQSRFFRQFENPSVSKWRRVQRACPPGLETANVPAWLRWFRCNPVPATTASATR